MPSFHYEAERWGIQFVIDPKSFAERHSPFFRGSPVTKQGKANEAEVSFCCKDATSTSPSLSDFDWGGGGGIKKKEAQGVND